ncbi:sulfotransferase [Acidocella aromatica]|uniref:Sulfotransferase family protein n=1 Tax=Acidocella aromatica TaxID=1303579 RepID=A0A840VHY4_9PROT|nr:sulfotransferase [Acidocella aromatica]MBB5372795.1 hypothetical protein [Acidocella aromatica]
MPKTRIFNLSLHRSGTQSFADFCQRNGLKTLHWPGIGFDLICRPALETVDSEYVWYQYSKIIGGFDAVADIPAPVVFREAMTNYPDAKFVLILREPAEWVKSVRQHVNQREMDVLEKMQYWTAYGKNFGDYLTLGDAELEALYRRFAQMVTDYARRRNVALGIFDLSDPELGQKLGAFLEVEGQKSFNLVDITKPGKA